MVRKNERAAKLPPPSARLCVRGLSKMIVLLSGTVTKRLSYKDNASEKGKSITEDGLGRKEKIQPFKREITAQEGLDFKALI